MLKINIPENWAEKPHLSLFCLFMRDPAHVVQKYSWSPYYKSTLRFLLSEYPLGYQLYQLFKILTYREIQNTGSWCRWKPCRLTTIHTNIPAIPITLLDMAL